MAHDLFGLYDTPNLLAVLQELADEVKRTYKDKLELHDRIASGDLIRSVQTEVEIKGTTYSVVMELADYWKFVEIDTRPHWPPKDAIDRWIFIKPVIPRPDGNGRIPTPAQLSYLIRRKIAEDGTTGTHDLRDAKDEILPKYEQRLMDALGRDTLAYLEKITP